MTKPMTKADSIDHIPAVEVPQIIALVGSHTPEDMRAAAADALIDTHVQFDYRIILSTVALILTYMAQIIATESLALARYQPDQKKG
ncbi:hypothetical protein EDB80DRAFT_882395 [Ilyonectria destructans]|nr:hypothetical protein EDB80DRAFT_882395 [Ilyonectria destructans]